MLREERTGENPSLSSHICRDGHFPSKWTVALWYRSQWKDYVVQGREMHTGAVVPIELRAYTTLGQARKSACQLYAVLTGSMYVLPWHPDFVEKSSPRG